MFAATKSVGRGKPPPPPETSSLVRRCYIISPLLFLMKCLKLYISGINFYSTFLSKLKRLVNQIKQKMKCMFAFTQSFWSINANNNGISSLVRTDPVPCFGQPVTVFDEGGVLQYNQTGRLRTAEGVLWRHRPC